MLLTALPGKSFRVATDERNEIAESQQMDEVNNILKGKTKWISIKQNLR